LLALIRGSAPAFTPAGGVGSRGADPVAAGLGLAAEVTGRGGVLLSYLVTADTVLIWFAAPAEPIAVERRAVSLDSLAALVRAWRLGLGVDAAGEPPAAPVAAAGGPAPAQRGIGAGRGS